MAAERQRSREHRWGVRDYAEKNDLTIDEARKLYRKKGWESQEDNIGRLMLDEKENIVAKKVLWKLAKLERKANRGTLTIDGPYFELKGRDQRGEYEILFDFAKIEINVLNYEGVSGDGFNEPREGGYVDDYEIVDTNIGKEGGLELIKVYADSDEEETVTDPAEIQAIEKSYLEQLDGPLQEKFDQSIQEAASEEQEARNDPYNNPNL